MLKYTDLFLSEALLHLQYTRKGFELKDGNLGPFKKPIEEFAKKLKKFDSGGSASAGASKSASKKASSSVKSA